MESGQLARDLLEHIVDGVSTVSDEFDRWGERYVRGPGLYFLVVDGSPASYADPMGDNRWPVDHCPTVTADSDRFVETAKTVGTTRDGAIVVETDGQIREQMVRLQDLRPADTAGSESPPPVEYQDWMGARHMSAVETSARPNVVATVTISEENGRVSMFVDGEECTLS